jgi:arachidonate 15-lipoxygenase
MTAFIPRRDPRPADRTRALDEARRDFQFNYTYVSPLAVVDRVPPEHEFGLEWLKVVGCRILDVFANRMELEGEDTVAEYLRAKHKMLSVLLGVGAEIFINFLRDTVSDGLKFNVRSTAEGKRAESMEDFAKLFRTIGLPPIASAISSDRIFANLRLAGPNPVMIHRVAGLDDRFPVTDSMLQAVIPGDTLAAAAAEGRMFLLDYSVLKGAEPGTYPHDLEKYVYAPLALFVVDKATRELRPVAIQCLQTPGPDNPVITPADGYNWLIAKTTVEIADGNIHEAVTHLARTHLLIEPFVICTYRQLAPIHPLFLLLAPHFEGTLAINDAAWRHLIANKGAVDKLCGASIVATRGLAVSGVQTYLFNEAMLPRALAARGVADAAWLANYAYRDDALLYWSAIRDWVSDYLRLYYSSDADVQDDPELKAWLAEIGAADGGRVAGFATAGEPTLTYLTEAVTMILFTCSVQHAAVNFPQYDIMSYMPAMPLAGYAPAPKSKQVATAADQLAIYPPLDMAELQMELGYILGTVHYTKLGQYSTGAFDDPQVAEPLARFQARLAEIDQNIAARNQNRLAYSTLALAGIPQSINI